MFSLKEFKKPDHFFGSTVLWGLNYTLDAEDLVGQIQSFYEQGFGGAVIHPRGGMVTEYLSDEYFDKIGLCIRELKKRGMKTWIYDEDWCPSGTAAGKVLDVNPDFAQKAMYPETVNAADYEKKPDDYAGFLIEGDSYKRINLNHPPRSGQLFVVSLRADKPFTAYNMQPYVDVCSKEALDWFLRITHDQYFKHFGKDFGEHIQAFFTDEPSFRVGRGGRPWTGALTDTFFKKYGYNLLDRLPDIFINTKTAKETRFQYWDIISSLFVSSYSKNIYDWCEEHNVMYTGHFFEHIFPNPIATGSVMPHYEHMHAPGMDMLFVGDKEQTDMYGNDFNVKEVSSVANQLGKKKTFSETYGASGWALDFRHQKQVFDWQLALGITHISQHISLYTLRGFRKRDFPLAFSRYEPWWGEYHILGTYIERMCYALSQGKFCADVLILHNSSSTWCEWEGSEDTSVMKELEASVKQAVKNMNRLQIMSDLGDDVIMEHHAKAENGVLTIGQMNYKVVIMPKMTTLRKSSYELLQKFVRTGGTLISVGQTPRLLEGADCPEMEDFFHSDRIIRLENTEEALGGFFRNQNVEKAVLTEKNNKYIGNVYAHIRREDGKKLILLCNLELDEGFDLTMKLDKSCCVTAINTETCETSLCNVLDRNGSPCIELSLLPNHSVLLLVDENSPASPANPEPLMKPVKTVKPSDWKISRAEPNAMTLQFVSVSAENEEYTPYEDCIRADYKLKKRFGMEPSDYNSRQMWMYSEDEKASLLGTVKAKYSFLAEDVPEKNIQIAVEWPDTFRVYINDTLVKPTGKFFKENAFSLYNAEGLVRRGENIIRIETETYSPFVSLEPVYVVGDFAVDRRDDQLFIAKEREMQMGNLVPQGYRYYSGMMEYETFLTADKDFDRATLKINGFDGICINVLVNGQLVSTMGWEPWEAEIGSYLQEGENQIRIQVINSMQNLLGPNDSVKNMDTIFPTSFHAEKHDFWLPLGLRDGITVSFEKKA